MVFCLLIDLREWRLQTRSVSCLTALSEKWCFWILNGYWCELLENLGGVSMPSHFAPALPVGIKQQTTLQQTTKKYLSKATLSTRLQFHRIILNLLLLLDWTRVLAQFSNKMSWLQRLIPTLLLPSFTWSHRRLGAVPLLLSIPSTTKLARPVLRRLTGILHFYLRRFSRFYCGWVGIEFDNQIAQLPFGLILKWSDGTGLEEVSSTLAARAAGFPVPKIISYGEHPDSPHAPVSILMTRLPGSPLGQVHDRLNSNELETIFTELKTILETMRNWCHPWGGERICSITGKAIRSVRVPNHSLGPCESESEFNDYLLSTASDHSFASRELFEEKLGFAKRMQSRKHTIVYTHGDLKHHNIMIHNGHISGFIDWESAGWYPEYWEFTTALRFCPTDFWWYDFVIKLGGSEYMTEMEIERALTALTIDSYVW